MLSVIWLSKANKYFWECMKKFHVCIVGNSGLLSFSEYLSLQLKKHDFYYSIYALLLLGSDDFLVSGIINTLGEGWNCSNNYNWVEFTFKGNEYVFDSISKTVTLKEIWYSQFKPRNITKTSQKEILDLCIMSNNPTPFVGDTYIISNIIHPSLSPLANTTLIIKDSKVSTLFAYDDLIT